MAHTPTNMVSSAGRTTAPAASVLGGGLASGGGGSGASIVSAATRSIDKERDSKGVGPPINNDGSPLVNSNRHHIQTYRSFLRVATLCVRDFLSVFPLFFRVQRLQHLTLHCGHGTKDFENQMERSCECKCRPLRHPECCWLLVEVVEVCRVCVCVCLCEWFVAK